MTTESVEVDFRTLSTDVVAINLDGCRSFSIDQGLPITKYSWKSSTYTSSIQNSSSCSTQIKIYETNYSEPVTEHFFLTVGDGKSTNEGTFSVHVLPSTSLPPQIILDTFPEKNIYTAGEKLDIESWKSYSYNDKPLLFSWIPLNQESRRISKTLRSRFQEFNETH